MNIRYYFIFHLTIDARFMILRLLMILSVFYERLVIKSRKFIIFVIRIIDPNEFLNYFHRIPVYTFTVQIEKSMSFAVKSSDVILLYYLSVVIHS